MDEVNVSGFHIGFERLGEGPPLVLLHGALSDSRSWRRQLKCLSDENTVVAWDCPGCGLSSDPPENFRLSDYADCLAAFIGEIGLERPHVLGLSFGSGLALEYFRRYPDAPRSLILASAYAGWAGSLPPEVVQKRLEYGLELSEWSPEHVVEAFLPSLFSGPVSDEVMQESVAIMSDFHPAGLREMTKAFAEADLRDVLPLIKIPTLLLYGECDQRAPLELARELNSMIPSSTLAVIPGAGHECNVEAPEVFNAEVRNFLTSIRART